MHAYIRIVHFVCVCVCYEAHVEVRGDPTEGVEPLDSAGRVSNVLSVQENQLFLDTYRDRLDLLHYL